MKITIKAKQEEVQKIPFDAIPVGMVYVAESSVGPVALKLCGNEAILLADYGEDDTDTPTDDCLMLCAGYKDVPAYKILGKLTEVVIDRGCN